MASTHSLLLWVSLLSGLILVPRSDATIVGGAVTNGTSLAAGGVFQKLSPPLPNPHGEHNTVGNNTFEDPNLYAFDEAQNIVVGSAPLAVDQLRNGKPGLLSAGTEVASHYVFFDPPPKGLDQRGYVDFNADIVGVITSRANLIASDHLARTGVTYLSPGNRGLETTDGVRIDAQNPRRLRVNWAASSPGDYLRILTSHAAPLAPNVTVGAETDPWLAGRPVGSPGSGTSTAPEQSPMEVVSILVRGGSFLTFRVQGGLALRSNPAAIGYGPDGNSGKLVTHPALSGISGCTAPLGALVGVFLDRELPGATAAPPALSFATAASRNYTNLAPRLRQVFFVGTGSDDSGKPKRVFIPEGATRLFLGYVETTNFTQYRGSFDAEVTAFPNPPLSVARLDETRVSLCWTGLPGTTAHLEYAEAPNATQWLPLGTPVDRGLGHQCVTDVLLPGVHRFYRLNLRF